MFCPDNPSDGAGRVVMVTELCSARPASYRNVVWVKFGSDIAGATAPREKADLSETVKLTGPD